MQGVNSQVESKEICDVLEAKAVVLGINGKGLVAGGAAGVTSVGLAALCQSQLLQIFEFLFTCVSVYTYICILLRCTSVDSFFWFVCFLQ